MSPPATRRLVAIAAGLAVAGAGALLVVGSVALRVRWFERHVLPNYCVSAPRDEGLITLARAALAVAGVVLLVVVAPLVARLFWRRPPRAAAGALLGVAVAIVLAGVASEGALTLRSRRARAPSAPSAEVPQTRGDERLGWRFAPRQRHAVHARYGDSVYELDSDGNRVRSADASIDLERPTLVLAGESVGFGQALPYDSTLAAILERELDLQVVNLSVDGYGNDQEYLRLAETLPRLRRPVAVVVMFLPLQLRRNVDRGRAHFVLDGGALRLVPAERGFLLPRLWRDEPYHGDDAIELTHALFDAIMAAVRARGARPLFLVTNVLEPCRASEGLGRPWIVDELFERRGLPYVEVDMPLDDTFFHEGDYHPNPRGARRLADAVEAALGAPLARRSRAVGETAAPLGASVAR